MYHHVILSLGSPTDDVKTALTKNHTTALSTGIKVNYKRLRDACSGHRVNLVLSSVLEPAQKDPFGPEHAYMVAKSPTWSSKIIPTWLYHQDFAKFPLNHHYNASMENCVEFLSKEMPYIKIDDNGLFEEQRRLNAYLNFNKLENQHAEIDKR
ncbi:hypothetical protein TNCV_2022571 [Trichonephila clavipes]|nr:hypothetical protein TNCV_2022571 [Trichonephila clavipes]